MPFNLIISENAVEDLLKLKKNKSSHKVLKAVEKALRFLEANPKHPGLKTHEFHEFSFKYGRKIYEAYAQNNTPGAYRVFWHYGPDENVITIIAVTPHP
jgi:mRNA-degrading endonuclease RelE of RelBE toxin-antitoxin system